MVNMRPFTAFEQKNLKFLVNHNLKFTQVEITPTGLGKGILDSTAPMRAYFLEMVFTTMKNNFKVKNISKLKQLAFLRIQLNSLPRHLFYRPNTKKGDPRMWIYGFGSYTEGNDIHVLFWHEQTLYSINITHIDIEKCYNSAIITPMQEVLKAINQEGNSVSEELLGRFRAVKNQWFESEVTADTGIGRTIESFLGISIE